MATFEELEGCGPEPEVIWDYPGIDRAAYPHWESPVERRKRIMKAYFNGDATRAELNEAEEAEIKYEQEIYCYNAWHNRLRRWAKRLFRRSK